VAIPVVILSFLFSQFLRVLSKRKIYYRFLDDIGEPVSNKVFFSKEYLMSAVPLNTDSFACSVRVEKGQIMFGASRHFRVIRIDSISDIEFSDYKGHKIAKVSIYRNTPEAMCFYIPWSDQLESEVGFKRDA
jgi:hypothetical protein